MQEKYSFTFQLFKTQLLIAQASYKPIVLHVREARGEEDSGLIWKSVLNTLKENIVSAFLLLLDRYMAPF